MQSKEIRDLRDHGIFDSLPVEEVLSGQHEPITHQSITGITLWSARDIVQLKCGGEVGNLAPPILES